MKNTKKTQETLKGVTAAMLIEKASHKKNIAKKLQDAGSEMYQAESVEDLVQATINNPAQILLVDLGFCEDVQAHIQENPQLADNIGEEIIVLSEEGDTEMAMQWARNFNGYFLRLPIEGEEMVILIERALDSSLVKKRLARYEAEEGGLERFGPIVVKSPEMKDVVRLARILANRDDCLLFVGPVGTGKEILARTIHEHSQRRHGHFFSINCRSFSNEELAAELFGREEGGREGEKSLVEMAEGGTLFLDEITSISPTVQGKLQRLIEEKCFTPVNSREKKPADVRVFASTSQPLEEMVASGSFSEDLFFRLNRFSLHLPALRRRVEDIPVLTKQILRRMAHERGEEPLKITEETLKAIMEYHWPGNLRELENVLDFASLVAGKGPVEPKHLPKQFHDEVGSLFIGSTTDELPPMSEIERRYIMKVMEATQGNKVKAAHILDINRATLHRKLQIYADMKKTEVV